MYSTLKKCLFVWAACAVTLFSQQTDSNKDSGGIFGGATPIVTGAFGFATQINKPSDLSFGPKFEPILIVPLGNKFLFETEYSMELPVERQQSSLGPAVLSHGFEYLQLTYLATSNLSITGGQFVTPFGIYKERLDPQWVRNLLDVPLIFPVNDNSSIGAMVRGSAYLAPKVKLNLAAYYSGSEGNLQISGEKQAGGRASVYLQGPRLEVGASYSRKLGDERFNCAGMDFVWNARGTPLDLRGEYVHADVLGQGYWLESAWRLSNATSNPFLRRSQIVGRVEQYFTPRMAQDLDEELPSLNTKRVTAGFNYWPSDGVKFALSYGREMDSNRSQGVWTVGLVYRFAWGRGE
jgi:hypothetical protein